MPTPSCCDRLTIRVVLLKVSPLVARLISVPDDLSLEELHDVLQLVFGWSGQAFYNFRIHGEETCRRRHLRTRLLRQFQLRRREKFLYTYDFLDLWEWEIRVLDLDIEPGSAEASQPRCLAGRAATPPEECGGPRGYMRILDQHKYYSPMAEQELQRGRFSYSHYGELTINLLARGEELGLHLLAAKGTLLLGSGFDD